MNSNMNFSNSVRTIRQPVWRLERQGRSNYMIAVVLLIIALIVLGGDIFYRVDYSNFEANSIQVNATCEKVWSQKRTRKSGKHSRTTYYVYYANVSYECNGQTYHQENIKVSSTTHKGSTIRIRVLESDPSVYRPDFEWLIFIAFLFVSFFVGTMSFAFFDSGKKNLLRARQARERGLDYVERTESASERNNRLRRESHSVRTSGRNRNNPNITYNGYYNGYQDSNSVGNNNSSYNNYGGYENHSYNSNFNSTNHNSRNLDNNADNSNYGRSYNSRNLNNNTNSNSNYGRNYNSHNNNYSGYSDRESNPFYTGNIFDDDSGNS